MKLFATMLHTGAKISIGMTGLVGTVLMALVASLLVAPFAFGLLFQRINRTDAEQVFGVVYNVMGATVTGGYAVVLDTSTFDGIRVTKPATATLSLLLGVANKDISDSSYGIAQLYGYRQSAFVTNDTSQAIAAGDILIPVNAQNYLARSAASDGKTGFVIAGQSFATATTPAAAQKNVFLRAL
jgi:hypothetical protein